MVLKPVGAFCRRSRCQEALISLVRGTPYGVSYSVRPAELQFIEALLQFLEPQKYPAVLTQ